MAKKLFVGNLSWNTTDATLREFFAAAGNVTSAQTISDRNTGKARGFGFVEFESDEEAQRAVQELNGKELDGRQIVVNEARERDDSQNRFRGGAGGGGSRGGDFRGGGNRDRRSFGNDRRDRY